MTDRKTLPTPDPDARPSGDQNAKDRDRADPSGPLHGQDPEEVARRMGTGGRKMADPTG